MIVYHGSNKIITNPDYTKGFYLTKYEELAKEWSYSILTHNDLHYCNSYELSTKGLTIIDLTQMDTLYWLASLMKYRQPKTKIGFVGTREYDKFIELYDLSKYKPDIIIGWRADDGYTVTIDAFVSGLISLQAVTSIFMQGDLGKQIVLKSKKSFDNIKYLNSTKVDLSYADKFLTRYKNANKMRDTLIENDTSSLEDRTMFVDIMKGMRKCFTK